MPTPSHREAEFKDELREARARKGMSVREAALACGYSVQQWRNFESGDAVPTLAKLERVCKAMDIEPRKAVRLWAREKLRASDSPLIKAALYKSRPEHDPPGTSGLRDPPGIRDLIAAAREFHLDDDTAGVALKFLELVLQYRKSLTKEPRSRRAGMLGEPKVINLNEQMDGIWWYGIEKLSWTKQQVVSASRAGLGYLATVVRIEAGCGAYHKHIEARYVDSGTEFFSVISGSGQLLWERNTDEREAAGTGSEWECSEIEHGSVGLYRGSRGHAYVNTGQVPLYVYVVCVPFPPKLESEKKGQGLASGSDFRIDALHRCDLPASLKLSISALLNCGDTSTS